MGYADTEIDRHVDRAAGEARFVRELVHLFDSREVFTGRQIEVVDGEERVFARLDVRTDDSPGLTVFTSKDDPRLPPAFAGSTFRTALEFALAIPPVEWVAITNSSGATVPIARAQIPAILVDLSRTGPDETVESLITAGDVAQAVWRLTGQEIYVQVHSEPPYLQITGSADGVDGFLQVFVTRSRPDLLYSAMSWESLVAQIRAVAALPGVRIINGQDDSIIVTRTDLGLTAPQCP